MALHIDGKEGDVGERVLLPGDPLRAKYVAETFLEGAVLYSQCRNMLGYTGTYKGTRISVQASGMGVPSAMIYVHELCAYFGVKAIIRIGSCGAFLPQIRLGDLIACQAACHDSMVTQAAFGGQSFSPCASFDLLGAYKAAADSRGVALHIGPMLTTDTFYWDDADCWRAWARYGVLGVDMETAGVYMVAAKHGVKSLAVYTVTDHLDRHERSSSRYSYDSYDAMVRLALDALVAAPLAS